MAWALTLSGDPPLAFLDTEHDAYGFDIDLIYRRLVSVPEVREELRIAGGENPSATIQIDNGDGAMTAILAGLPHSSRAILWENGDRILEGAIASTKLQSTVEMVIET